MAKMLNCVQEVSKFELQLRYYVHFGLIPLGKSMNLLMLLLQIWLKYCHYCCSTRMALSLNNPEVWYAIKQRNQEYWSWVEMSLLTTLLVGYLWTLKLCKFQQIIFVLWAFKPLKDNTHNGTLDGKEDMESSPCLPRIISISIFRI